jgi:glycosyltransferase 2 family protein
MRFLKIALIALGCYILYATIHAVGVENLWNNIASLQGRLVPLLFFYPLIFAWDTLGWAYSFPEPLPKRVLFRDIYSIRIIGEALNAIIPFSASLGGEPVKAELLRRRHDVALSDGLASILIVHTTFWVSLNMFVIGGILVTVKTLPLTPVLWNSVLAFLLVLGSVAIALIVGLHLGIFKRVHAIGEKWNWWGPLSLDKSRKFLELDKQIKSFYTENPTRFLLSVFYKFLGWFTGAFEVWYMGKILGMPIGFAEAWLLEALIQVLRIVTFFIPSSIGAQEGGIVLIFSQFGYATPLALTFAVIRRLREIVFIGVGLLLWSFVEDKPALRKAK